MKPDETIRSAAKSLPYPVQSALRWGATQPARSRNAIRLGWDKHRIVTAGRKGSTVRLADFDVRINDGGVTPFDLYEDIFVNRVYDFEAQRPDPRILDCGTNIGMSVLYFKQRYPLASVVGFEPDPTILPFLRENLDRNSVTGVEVVHAALGARPGTLILNSDGGAASHLEGYEPEGDATDWATFEVPCVRLSDYLDEPVDYMKMNIEGAEYEVLGECEPKIRQIREMNIEYHRLPGVPCTLHEILELLARNGFLYTVSDFGLAMYGSARPPVDLGRHARWWRQIYACRASDVDE